MMVVVVGVSAMPMIPVVRRTGVITQIELRIRDIGTHVVPIRVVIIVRWMGVIAPTAP
jgi:hypothetical protein